MVARIRSILRKISRFRRGQSLSWPSLIRHVLRWYCYEKLSLDEILVSGAFLLKNSESHEQRAYPTKLMVPFLRQHNSHDPELISDKAIFSQFVKGIGVAVPKTLAIFDPGEKADEAFGITDSLEFVFEREDWLELFTRGFPKAFIVKPALGQWGAAIDIYRRQDDGSFSCKSTSLGAEQLYERIVRKQQYGKCVIQEVAKNHPDIVTLTGSSALQCLRILTVRSKNDGIKVFSCELKIAGSADQETDNFKGGRTGNILCKVAVDTGVIYDAMCLDIGKGEYSHPTRLPLTQQQIIGFKVPHFQAALDITLLAHRSVWGLKFVGWDVAITDQGPLVIEGNWLWGGSSLTTPWFNYQDFAILTKMAG